MYRFQFSLKTLLVCMLGAAIVCVFLARYIHSGRYTQNGMRATMRTAELSLVETDVTDIFKAAPVKYERLALDAFTCTRPDLPTYQTVAKYQGIFKDGERFFATVYAYEMIDPNRVKRGIKGEVCVCVKISYQWTFWDKFIASNNRLTKILAECNRVQSGLDKLSGKDYD